MSDPRDSELIYDWNRPVGPAEAVPVVAAFDETLRDGLQSPAIREPDQAGRRAILDAIASVGIEAADLGFPGAGLAQTREIESLLHHLRARGFGLEANLACRALPAEIERIAELRERTGVPLVADVFIGASPLRQAAEGWNRAHLVALVEQSLRIAERLALPVLFVTEDTTRAEPDDLAALYRAALDLGARRLAVCDTTGHAAPEGAARVVSFVRGLCLRAGRPEVGIDWHGHRDRNLDLVNALAAVRAGASRVHGTALGIGERCGNTALDLLLANFKLMGWIERDLSGLRGYVQTAATHLGVPIPDNYPIFGRDAFVTGTGVHAAAIVKALRRDDRWLADRVYSAVPASDFGAEQRISVGFMSGRSNVIWWLETHGYDPKDHALVERLLQAAKASDRLLTDAELHALARAP